MCIRDRIERAAIARRPQRRIARGELRRINIERLRHARASVCLLYTSDAAAERSSVDLGGRRIIKQKNNQPLVRSTGHSIYIEL